MTEFIHVLLVILAMVLVGLFITAYFFDRKHSNKPLRRVWIQRTEGDNGNVSYTIMPENFNPAGQGNGGNVTYHNCMMNKGGYVYMESENQYIEPCNKDSYV